MDFITHMTVFKLLAYQNIYDLHLVTKIMASFPAFKSNCTMREIMDFGDARGLLTIWRKGRKIR